MKKVHPVLSHKSRLSKSKKKSGQRIHACLKKLHLSNEKKVVFQVFFGDYTTQLCGDYNKPINHFSGSLSNNQDSMESKGPRVCFVAHLTKRNLRSKHLASQARENVRSLANGRPWVAGCVFGAWRRGVPSTTRPTVIPKCHEKNHVLAWRVETNRCEVTSF